MTNSMEIAKTIRSQIVATDYWALGAWGARNFVAGENGLHFSVRGSKMKTGGKIKVILKSDDTYTVTAYRVRGANVKVLSEVEGVYCDMLVSIIDNMVG